MTDFGVAVVGLGFAGFEAALASARLGIPTIGISTSLDWKYFPCSTGMGGPGRGHLLREISALGGKTPLVADRTYIHRRLSNFSKGPAVSSLFYLVDENRYSIEAKKELEKEKNLFLYQGRLDAFEKKEGVFTLYFADGSSFSAKTLIIAAGTFLGGKVIQGSDVEDGGRKGLYSSKNLRETIEKLGFKTGRFRTGTPPRVLRGTFDVKKFEVQNFEESLPFGFDCFRTPEGRRQVFSYSGKTGKSTENLAREIYRNFGSVNDYSVLASGPRHCPSFVDKVLRFESQSGHRIFIFPTNGFENEYIISGLGLYFDHEAQLKVIRTIEGLENAEIVRP